ncbi:GNAT family acetyltransferase [Companilactobacillus hulinensis]|uniref:GNAT family acetyltransferase n=1 Tax=Companilactobacillus hulinensis TaxID=2486007 RepID=UPI000F76773E|nr:GNAT family acetyltransferase [Companilactobacillus hulinensis]
MGYKIVQLKDIDDEDLEKVFRTFSSVNEDVESFLKYKSIQFEKMDLSRTYLVFSEFKNKNVLVGYYSITNKPLIISKTNFSKFSNSLKKQLLGIGHKTERDNYEIKSILVGQLGKNQNHKNLITGAELLVLIYKTIEKIYQLIGGRIIYLEVDDEIHLRKFYTENGFKEVPKYRTPNNQCLYIRRINSIISSIE